MTLLSSLIDSGFRQPAACLIQAGASKRPIGALADQVKSVEIATSRSEAWSGTIVFEDRREPDGRWMVADSGVFSRWERVTVLAGFGVRNEEVFRGFVKSLKPNFPNNAGEATFEVQLQDDSSLLDREHQRKVWGADAPITDLAIMKALLAGQSLAPAAGCGTGRSARSLNQDATPIRFLRERAIANGYELIFDQGQVYFGPMRLTGEALPALTVYAGPGTNCISFTVDDDALRPDAVTFDVAAADGQSSNEGDTVRPNLPLLGLTPAAAEGASLPAPANWRLSREGDEPRADTEARAQALVNEHSLRLKASGEADGSLYGHVLKPGRLVRVDGAGERYGGLYYIDTVGHSFGPDGYRQAFQLLRNATGDAPAPFASLGGLASVLSALF